MFSVHNFRLRLMSITIIYKSLIKLLQYAFSLGIAVASTVTQEQLFSLGCVNLLQLFFKLSHAILFYQQ